jgi:peptidyl-prolyl cis-trans isomerase B (cyclophilin B)
VFHRLVRHGIIQGGDPLSTDPARRDQYGTGGLGVLQAELNAEKHTRGAVSAVLVPGKRDSAGAQFFICIADQPALDGQYTVFGRVSEGLNVATKISEAAVDAEGRAVDRIEIKSLAIRDTPPPAPIPFTMETPAELGQYRAVLETSMGAITLEFMPDKAPETVRNFLRLATAGVFDGTAFHRVARGFVIQTGFLPTRSEPLDEKQQKFVGNLAPEFNDTTHVKGIVSMARGDDPASATTSFFIVTGNASAALDRQYTAFARVTGGMDVVDKIDAVPVTGEAPVTRVELTRVRVEK